LQQLTDAVERFQSENFSDEGKLPAAPPSSSHDEIGRLAVTFNVMAARIVGQMRELKRNDAARRELFANISHDLRTPLSSLLGYLETISMKEQLSEAERHQYCEIAAQEARHLTVLVDNLLELAKLDAPEASISREPFMLHELVGAITGKFALAASRKGVTLTRQSSQPVPVVSADPALIERVLENLVDNALRHTPAGGTVSIDLIPEAKGVTVRVSDTGSGIPKEDLPRIFDRFYRGQKSRQIVSNSAGLGLAICKRVLELHDSSISVESQVGVGTRFTFALPLADGGQAPSPLSPLVRTNQRAKPELCQSS
jgi:signal transduction histidine kinase